MKASAVAYIGLMEELLKADPNVQDSSGWTALMYAAQGVKLRPVDPITYSSGVEAVKIMLNFGENPDTLSFMGQTALMAAVNAYYAPVERVRSLITAGTDVNLRDANGYTAIIHALNYSMIMDSPAEICKVLRSAGARTDLRDAEGLTVFDHLERHAKRFMSTGSFDGEMKLRYENLLRILQQH
jgi:ankyrin repeat protein